VADAADVRNSKQWMEASQWCASQLDFRVELPARQIHPSSLASCLSDLMISENPSGVDHQNRKSNPVDSRNCRILKNKRQFACLGDGSAQLFA